MKLSAPFLLLAAAIGVVQASGHDGLPRMGARHHNVARHDSNDDHAKRASSGRCKTRSTSTLISTSSSTPKATSTKATSTKKNAPTGLTTGSNGSSGNNDSGNKGNSNNNNGSESNPDSGNNASTSVNLAGLIRITDWSCGNSGATKELTATHGPNGNIDWMNCGLTEGGWNPPHVTVNDVVTVSLYDALKDPNTPFTACSKYIDTFVNYANQHGIPPIIIASIAMQESTCNPHEVGGGGEQGLMQISKDKCGGAPNGDCQDVDFNIRTGTKFFADTLNANGGNLLLTLGNYNGWPQHMTVGSATAARWSSCCLCQNNMDYLVQNLNGWYLNKDPYTGSPRIGKYFNLDNCH